MAAESTPARELRAEAPEQTADALVAHDRGQHAAQRARRRRRRRRYRRRCSAGGAAEGGRNSDRRHRHRRVDDGRPGARRAARRLSAWLLLLFRRRRRLAEQGGGKLRWRSRVLERRRSPRGAAGERSVAAREARRRPGAREILRPSAPRRARTPTRFQNERQRRYLARRACTHLAHPHPWPARRGPGRRLLRRHARGRGGGSEPSERGKRDATVTRRGYYTQSLHGERDATVTHCG